MLQTLLIKELPNDRPSSYGQVVVDGREFAYFNARKLVRWTNITKHPNSTQLRTDVIQWIESRPYVTIITEEDMRQAVPDWFQGLLDFKTTNKSTAANYIR
jgi:hypothetical protein